MINLGLMGCGTVAGYGHLPAIRETAGLNLQALFDPNEKQVRIAGEKFAVPRERCFTDLASFLESDLHAVTVTSPAPYHCANVLAAAEMKLHVLCEKPLAEAEDDALRMINAMKRADRQLVVGFIYRFSPMALKVREIIRNGEIGELRSIRLIYLWDCHGKYAREGNPSAIPSPTPDAKGRRLNLRRDRFMQEGGPMIDCGVHEIDLAPFWAGAPIERFSSHGTRIDDVYPTPDHICIHATHANGVHSMMEASFSYTHTAKQPQVHYRFEAIGTDGVVCFNYDKREFFLANAAGTTQFDFSGEKGFGKMYAQFRQLIETGDRGTFATGDDALIASKIARLATYRVNEGEMVVG